MIARLSIIPVLLILNLTVSHAQSEKLSLAPGYSDLGYELPVIGSYNLPPLGLASDGEILDSDGNKTSMHNLFDDSYVLLAFIYSSCSDVNGCPLTSHVFYQIKSEMNHDAELARHLKLVSLSFDPETDTPETLAQYGNNFRHAGNAGEWLFATTSSVKQLAPILKAYNQDIQRQYTSDGRYSAGYAHVLRVFLIDPEKRIRNIYSVEFLHLMTILNDVKTLLLQAKSNRGNLPKTNAADLTADQLRGPGDNKTGYEDESYTTRSRAVELRQGVRADLFTLIQKPPPGLPVVPEVEKINRQKIQLGRKLFFDRRLSLNDTFSCAMCHIPEQGFTSNEISMAVGIEGRSVRRNSPTLYNVAYAELLFHDGRENRLEQQVWGPLLAKNEMGNPSVGYVIDKVKQIKEYDGLFESAFDGRSVSMETLGSALASYQRVLVSGDSPFDRWFFNNQPESLSVSARRGFDLFTAKAGCSACHIIAEKSALFMDNLLHNTGIGYRESMGDRPEKQALQIAPGVSIEIDSAVIDQVGEPAPADVGRYEITQNPADRWKYKTPSLRNIVLTAPYMHNGSLSTLGDVIDFYDAGGVANEGLSPLIKPLFLTDQDKQDLLQFLESLTGSNVDSLVADAFAAPIGDISNNN